VGRTVVKAWPAVLGFLARGAFWSDSIAPLLRSQIPYNGKLGIFTVFACLIIPVSVDITQIGFNKPAGDASPALCKHVRPWLHRVVVARQDIRSASTTLWARPITMLAVVR